jgi:hypothetical protein
MHLDANLVRNSVIVLFLVALFSSKMIKGSSKRTSEGLVFPMKVVFTAIRFVALPVYYGFFFYMFWQAKHVNSWPMTVLFVLVMALMASQAPGTIVLTEFGVEQRYWFLKRKVILYPEVMAVQKTQAGRSVAVLGDNRVKITHTANHCDQAGFEQAMAERTGKRVLL